MNKKKDSLNRNIPGLNDPEKILSALEKIDDAIQMTRDVVVVMDNIIHEVRQVFQSDRAWLFYPCNPGLPYFNVAFESTTPSYTGAKAQNEKVQMTRDMADRCHRALSRANEPLIDPLEGAEISNDISILFNVKSSMFMALQPQVGDAWMFGLHQCDHARVWTAEDKKLFKMIGNRITNCIGNMLHVEQLKKSEERYRTLVNTAPYGIQVTDGEGKIVFSNPAHHTIQGFPNGELVGEYIWDLISDENDKSKTKAYYEKIVKEQPSPQTYFSRDRTRDGRLIHTQIDWDYLYSDQGKLEGIISIIADITAQKKAEVALRSSEQKYRHLIQTASDAIYLISENGRFVDVNPAACNMLNRSREEILNLDISGIDPSFSVAAFLDFWKETPLNEPRIFETNHLHKDGALVPVEVSGQKFQIGTNVLFFGIARNIAARKKAEAAIIESRSLLNTLLESIPMPVFYKNAAGRYLGFNKAYESFFGKCKDELIGKTVFDISPVELAQTYYARDQELLSKGGAQRYESQVLNAKGELRDVIFNKAVYLDRQGSISGLIGVILDITESKKAETEREKLQVKLMQSQKMESIGNLAGGIAHDFNNILSSIIGFTELSLDEVSKGTSLEDSLQEVYSAGKRAKDLVKQILAFARQSDEKRSPIQPSMVAKDVLKFIRSTIPTTIEIQQTITSESWITGNPTHVYQVLMNLCTNAAHAMEQSGGVLAVGLKDVHFEKKDLPADLMPGDYVEIKVSDTGEGIAPEIVELIFEPYFTTKEVGEGTGMGLAMVQGIVESYGGVIKVNSILGKGTTLTIFFPITRMRKERNDNNSEKLPTGGERILFVDDEAPIARMAEQILSRLGYATTICTGSLEALELFKSKSSDFDLVISDMTMPNMTGDVLAVELMTIRPEIPVILCTGYSKRISDEFAAKIGIKAIVYKPIARTDFAKTIRSVLDAPQKMKISKQ
jgi:PAS domain S-box-containing protein